MKNTPRVLIALIMMADNIAAAGDGGRRLSAHLLYRGLFNTSDKSTTAPGSKCRNLQTVIDRERSWRERVAESPQRRLQSNGHVGLTVALAGSHISSPWKLFFCLMANDYCALRGLLVKSVLWKARFSLIFITIPT